MQVAGRSVSAHIFLSAGGEVCYWLGGFDYAWRRQHPSLVTILSAIEHAWAVGDSRVDLGCRPEPYKYRFAEADETLEWWTFALRGPRYPLIRLLLLPKHAYRFGANRLPSLLRTQLERRVPRAPSWAR